MYITLSYMYTTFSYMCTTLSHMYTTLSYMYTTLSPMCTTLSHKCTTLSHLYTTFGQAPYLSLAATVCDCVFLNVNIIFCGFPMLASNDISHRVNPMFVL